MNGFKPISHYSGSGKSSNQRMRRRRGNTFPPGKQTPDNRCEQTGQNNRQRDKTFDNRLRYCIGYTKISNDIFSNKKMQQKLKNAAQMTA